MDVPITSDLGGYQDFWSFWLKMLAAVGFIVIVELGALLWTLWRK